MIRSVNDGGKELNTPEKIKNEMDPRKVSHGEAMRWSGLDYTEHPHPSSQSFWDEGDAVHLPYSEQVWLFST